MGNGNLGNHLFKWKEVGILPLTWKQRLSIALDVAKGVEYLHSLAQEILIHRDLKPSKILLGKGMRAKVSDFRFIRSAPNDSDSIPTRIVGTFDYMAQEYAASRRVTPKVDVYAFGVIWMELLTIRKALHGSSPDETLVSWFRPMTHDEDAVKTVLDPLLFHAEDEDTFQEILKVVEHSSHCTAQDPHRRPHMSQVVIELTPLVRPWNPTPKKMTMSRSNIQAFLRSEGGRSSKVQQREAFESRLL